MAETKKNVQKTDTDNKYDEIRKSGREVGTANPDPNVKGSRGEPEVGISNPDPGTKGQTPARREIGRVNNQNPREQKPEEQEIGIVRNESDAEKGVTRKPRIPRKK